MMGRTWIWHENHLQRVQIKRGTLIKEFLNFFLFVKTFVFAEALCFFFLHVDGSRINRARYYLWVFSSETVSFFLPLARRLAKTARPLADSMRDLKPCLFFLLRCDG